MHRLSCLWSAYHNIGLCKLCWQSRYWAFCLLTSHALNTLSKLQFSILYGMDRQKIKFSNNNVLSRSIECKSTLHRVNTFLKHNIKIKWLTCLTVLLIEHQQFEFLSGLRWYCKFLFLLKYFIKLIRLIYIHQILKETNLQFLFNVAYTSNIKIMFKRLHGCSL